MQPVNRDSPDWPAWVEEQARASAAAPTLYANRFYLTQGGGFVRFAIGDQYGEQSVYRGAYLMGVNDAEEFANLLLDQVRLARQAEGAHGGAR